MTYQQIQQIKNKLLTYCFADCKKETCLKCLIKECIIDLEKEEKEGAKQNA